MTSTPSQTAAALVFDDARAAFAWLSERLAEHARDARAHLSSLARSVRVVVPTLALRELLADRLCRALGGALVGVRIQTHWNLALEILERAGGDLACAPALAEVVMRRSALAERELERALGGLEDGAALASASLSDLLSARLGAADPAAVARALSGLAGDEEARARALVQAAERARAALARAGRQRVPDVHEAAARALRGDASLLQDTAAIYLFGFSDVIGQVAELLAALSRPGLVLLAVEPREADDRGPALRLAQRLDLAATRAPAGAPGAAAPPRAEAFSAVGLDAELDEVARRARDLIDRGVRPESIAVVARSFGARATLLRRAFLARGVPWSGAAEPFGSYAADRRLRAALQLLRQAGSTQIDVWLDAIRPTWSGDLEGVRAALRAAGVVHLRAAAQLSEALWLAEVETIPLPHRGALPPVHEASEEEGEGSDDAGAADVGEAEDGAARPSARPRRRSLEALALRQAAADARALLELLDAWPQRAEGNAPRAALDGFTRALGWQDAARAPWDEACRAADELEDLVRCDLSSEVPTREEVAGAIERALGAAASERGTERAVHGRGAGVRVLEAQAARGTVFEHQFLIGLERGTFPRAATADPLLTDAARARLRSALPDLADGERQELTEHWLALERLGAADHVTLSWRRADADGAPCAPAPFFQRWLEERGVAVQDLPQGAAGIGHAQPRDAIDATLALALGTPNARRGDLCAPFAAAFAEAFERFPHPAWNGLDPNRLARARLEVLDEIEPDRGSAGGRARAASPGPYTGAAGASAFSGRDLFVTRLEHLARCPWQAFLTRELGIEAFVDPLHTLPDLAPALVGVGVHAALQHLLEPGAASPASPESDGAPDAAGTTLGAALARGPRPRRAWSSAEVDAAIARAARETLEREGLRLTGLARALEARAKPYVARALELLQEVERVYGCELEGSLDAFGTLAFRADLGLERAGAVELVDVKTGRPLSKLKTDAGRRREWLRKLESGRALQAMAYALSTPGASGAYLVVDPSVAEDLARAAFSSDDREARAAFESALGVLVPSWRQGVVPPRPETADGKANRECETCEVRMACVRDDSAGRRRVMRLAAEAGDAPAGSFRAAAQRVLALDSKKGDGGKGAQETGEAP